jgi:hypothetical protein
MENEFKLILNHITAGEQMINISNPEKLDEYNQAAALYLNKKGKHLFEEDLLKDYREGMTLERLFNQESDRFVPAMNHKKDGKFQKTWYDIAAYEEIRREDQFFDYFFACKLRHVGLLGIDSFLSYHVDYSFNSNKKEYFRFLNLVLRQHQERLLAPNIVETVKEWIKLNETDSDGKELSGTGKDTKIKGKVKRERDDNVTKLNQEQTALLIYCLQAGKIILKDENLNNKEAGQAFALLTGYSADSLRQNLNKAELERISTKKNFDAISNILTSLQLLISREIKNKK